jgi:hypothetical protein
LASRWQAPPLAGDAGIAALTGKAVEGRLRKMTGWMAHILAQLLVERQGAPRGGGGATLGQGLVDGSLICARGGDGRLHARYDRARSRFGDLVLTSAHQAEQTDHIRIGDGQLIVQRAWPCARAQFSGRAGGRKAIHSIRLHGIERPLRLVLQSASPIPP